jgi:uncharacterized protein YndB with AHSA1/START domain
MPVRDENSGTEYGTVEQTADGRWRLRFTRTLAHPVDRVWRAITEPEHLAAWFPTSVEGARTPGAPLRFTFPRNQAPPFAGQVVAFEPTSRFEFQWGPDLIRVELEAAGGGTRLTLFDTLDERGKAARDAAGWHTCLDALAAALDGSAGAGDPTSTWAAVHPHYLEEFGADAATIGPPRHEPTYPLDRSSVKVADGDWRAPSCSRSID